MPNHPLRPNQASLILWWWAVVGPSDHRIAHGVDDCGLRISEFLADSCGLKACPERSLL